MFQLSEKGHNSGITRPLERKNTDQLILHEQVMYEISKH